MDELHVGKTSAYEKEARELLDRLKCKGVILIVVDGDRPGADKYEVASGFKGPVETLMQIPGLLAMLALKFSEDIKKLMTNLGSRN